MLNWFSFTSEAEPPPPLLDVGFIERLETHLGAEIITELLADGMIEIADRIERLQADAREGKVDAVARLCHDIAGASGQIGLSRLSRAAADLNRILRDDTGDHARALRDPLVPVGAESIEALGAFVAERAPRP